MHRFFIAGVGALTLSCAGGTDGGTQNGSPATDDGAAAAEAPADLATSLIARVAERDVAVVLSITNAGGEAVRLDFNSGQRFDVSVSDVEGEEVWRWSEGRSFIQALGSETLAPGATLSYETSWPEPAAGNYRVAGWVTASNRDIRQEVDVRVPLDGEGPQGP
ncbi:MAG: BsuPI-related putative proteinase inhibitor [Gemmatimonadota bacterium]